MPDIAEDDVNEGGYTVADLACTAEAVGRAIGRSVDACLGNGQEGAVFALDDGSVLKVTVEPCEAAVCLAMAEAPAGMLHPALPRIYGVWRLGCVTDPEGDVLYAIRRSDLSPPADLAERVARGLDDVVYSLGFALTSAYPPMITEAMEKAGRSGFGDVAADLAAVVGSLRTVLEVRYHDLKADNIGQTPEGVWAVFDFGRCSPPSDALERVLFDDALALTLEPSAGNDPSP